MLANLKPLTKKEEHEFLSIYFDESIPFYKRIEARNAVILSNLKFTFKIASKYVGNGIPLSTLISEANSALMYAIDKFDITKDVKILSYAKWWIEHHLSDIIIKKRSTLEDDLDENYNVNKNESLISSSTPYDKMTVTNVLNSLSNKEKDIVSMKYGLEPYNKTHVNREIAEKYNVSIERIRQILDRSLLKMRVYALSNNLEI